MSENKKPRIAEILGVEVGERFSLMGFQPHYVEFWIKSDGTFETNPPRVPNSSVALLRAVEQPCFVIRKPRRPCWTENEIKMAKAIKALWPDAEDIRVRDGVIGEVEYRVCAGCVVFGVIYVGYFPTMQCGENYALDEIIGGTE